MLILFGMLPIVKQFAFWWTHLPDLSCVLSLHFASHSTLHTGSRMPEELCLLAHPLLWHRSLPFYFTWAFPRHGCPADPTSCSSAPGQVGWLRGYIAHPCSSDTEEHNGRVPGSVHRTRVPLPGITKPENQQQHSTECMDVKTPIVFKVRTWEEKINILLAATRNVFFWRPVTKDEEKVPSSY